MDTDIIASEYALPATFVAESERIFDIGWHLLGYTHEIEPVDSWITAKIGAVPVFVQRFESGVRGYVNVCSHRFSTLRPEGRGVGCVQCPYHGWRYDDCGVPSAIPSKPRFDDLTKERIQELKLQEVRISLIGPYIFGALNPRVSCEEWIGGFASTLMAFGDAMGDHIGDIDVKIAANWKFVVENTLEGYHLDWIHPTTLGKLDFKYPAFTTAGSHITSYMEASAASLASFQKIDSRFSRRPFKNQGYFHTVLFPNLGFATLYGMTFAVQRFIPISPVETHLKVQMFITRCDNLSPVDRSLLKNFGETSLEFSRRVCDEDRAIVERQQLGVSARQQRGILSDEECRIGHFHKSYRVAMR